MLGFIRAQSGLCEWIRLVDRSENLGVYRDSYSQRQPLSTEPGVSYEYEYSCRLRICDLIVLSWRIGRSYIPANRKVYCISHQMWVLDSVDNARRDRAYRF
jgi:hypothetical protein